MIKNELEKWDYQLRGRIMPKDESSSFSLHDTSIYNNNIFLITNIHFYSSKMQMNPDKGVKNNENNYIND